MSRFYFHLSNSDECLRDEIGCDVSDLAAAHFRAKELARRVTTFSGLASHEPDWRRWTVTVMDDCQCPVLTVMFAPWFVFKETRGNVQMNGVRVLQQRLSMLWEGTTPPGAVAELVGNEGGVVSGVFNLESSDVSASDWRPRHDEHYHEA